MDEKTRLEILNDPVYAPNSPFFWPGTVSHDEEFAFCDPFDCRSTKDFLENYEDDYSGVEFYIEDTEDPQKKYIDEMYAHFHKLYHGIESWPYNTFVVSALYRMIFHEVFPYQSKLYEVTRNIDFDDLNRAYLSKGLYDRAITAVTLQSLEKTQQDKEIDKVGGRISESTRCRLIMILRDLESDPLVCQEIIRLLEQYNLTDSYPEEIKKEIILTFKLFFYGKGVPSVSDTKAFKAFTDRLLLCLSLLRIPTEKGEQAIKSSLADKSDAPFIDLVQANAGSDFRH